MEYTVPMFINATPDGVADESVETRVDLTCNFLAGRPAVMYLRNGDPGYPADPDECELIHVSHAGILLKHDHPLTVLLHRWMEDDETFYLAVGERVSAFIGEEEAEALAMYERDVSEVGTWADDE